MKIVFLLVLFILNPSCVENEKETQNSQNVETYQLWQLPSGKQIKVKRKGKIDFPYGQNSVFVVNYKTEIPSDDWEALRKEIDEIWGTIQTDVEKVALKEVVIRAYFDDNDSYGFAYSQQDDGKWDLVKEDTSRY